MKRRILSLTIITVLVTGIVGCGQNATHNNSVQQSALPDTQTNDSSESAGADNKTTEDTTTETGSNILIVYFTRADNISTSTDMVDAVASASINVDGSDIVGNNAILAQYIQEITGGDTFSIQTVEQYPAGYRDTTNLANDEKADNARPELANHVENMNQYDTIFLGYPNWWGTIPMALYTFLEEYDFSGKTIIPFASHEGSGLGSGSSAIADTVPDATLLDGFAVRGSDVAGAKDNLEAWIVGLDF